MGACWVAGGDRMEVDGGEVPQRKSFASGFWRPDGDAVLAHGEPGPQSTAQGHQAHAHKGPLVRQVVKHQPAAQHRESNDQDL